MQRLQAMRFKVVLGVTLVVSGFLATALAQEYPRRPVRLIAASTPGSGPDLLARLVAQQLTIRLSQQVIVDNRAGAGGNLGAELAAKSPPDGYTLFLTTSSQAISATLYRKLNYDLVRDFVPVSFIASAPQILAVHPSVPANSVKQLVALAKARPGQLLFGTGGIGTAPHLAGEMFRTETKISFVHVPYKGSSTALTDLLGGQTHFTFSMAPIALPHVKSNRLRALAITSAQRSMLAPGIPSMGETYPGFEAIGWYGVLAPSGTPAAIVERLSTETQISLRAPEVIKRLTDQGTEPMDLTPTEFGNFIKREIGKWGKAVIASNAQAD